MTPTPLPDPYRALLSELVDLGLCDRSYLHSSESREMAIALIRDTIGPRATRARMREYCNPHYTVGRRLRHYRTKAGLTRPEMVGRVNRWLNAHRGASDLIADQHALYRVEFRGQRLNVIVAGAISATLGIKIEDLLPWSSPRPSSSDDGLPDPEDSAHDD